MRSPWFVAGVLACAPSLACAPVPPSGAKVHIAQEEAIIIWDAKAKTQHFIRRGLFDTDAKDFGFLVPTPSQPHLEEAEDEGFKVLAKLTEPERRKAHPSAKGEAKSAPPAPVAVTVLEQKKVAGLDAAVLEATEAEALDAWLKKHGYASSPELVEWYRPYVAAKWKITAFKIDAGGAMQARSKAVRMSFTTDTPFFPYREPDGAESKGGRLLRVYALSETRLDGKVGKSGAWAGDAVWAAPILDQDFKRILNLAKLPEASGLSAPWLTEFEDRSSTRRGLEDVFFFPAADQGLVSRPVVYVQESRPMKSEDVLLAILIAAGLLWLGYKGLRWIYRRDPA